MFKTISKLIKRNKNSKKNSLEAEKLAKLIFKKNNLIIETFANLKDNNSARSKEYLKSLIMKELKTDQIFPNVFSGDLCFIFDDITDLNYEISYTNGFNFSCSSRGGVLNGFSCEYFHKIEIFSLHLKTKKDHLKGEETTDLAESVYWSLLGASYITRGQFEMHYLEK
jgi:hypothetical protein